VSHPCSQDVFIRLALEVHGQRMGGIRERGEDVVTGEPLARWPPDRLYTILRSGPRDEGAVISPES